MHGHDSGDVEFETVFYAYFLFIQSTLHLAPSIDVYRQPPAISLHE